MDRTIGEAKALKILDIPDFKHLTKEKAVQLVSMLDRVDPEVAKAVLEQYPKFAEVVLSTARDWKENVGKALEENGKVAKETVAAVSAAMASLNDFIGREDITPEERFEMADRMIELAKLLNEIDRRNKDFMLKVLGVGGATLVGFVAVAAAVLGVNVKIPDPKALRGAADAAKDLV